ncbi:uncharacterized protein [Excalfactoria chinensis]|uniref:uncharacterized protein n=1 Tax=Excalfactoria chinensis TaxID=46218 RepID=UPI003B3BCADA
MLCLLPTQDSPLPMQLPNISTGTLVSAQQILTVSNSSLLDPGNLPNLSLSSLILVKPIFILFPTDRPGLQGGPSPGGEGKHKTLLFTNQQGVNAVTAEHSRDIPAMSARVPRSPPTAPLTAGKLLSSSLPAVGLPDPPLPAQPPLAIARTVEAQPSKEAALQGTRQGSAPTASSARTQCAECLRSARTTNYPLRVSTSPAPSQFTPQSTRSSEPLQRLPSPAGIEPSTAPASPAPPTGSERSGSAAGSTAGPGAALHPRAAPTPPSSISPDLAKHLELTPAVPKPSAVMETPTLTPVLSPFSAEAHMKTTTSGKLLAAVTHPRMYTGSSAGLPSSVAVHVLLPSAVKHDRSTRTQGSVGEDVKPTEVSSSARKTPAGSSTALFDTRPEQHPAAAQGSQAALAPVQSASAEAVIETHSSAEQHPGPPTTGSAVGLPLSTEEEEEVGPREVTEEAAEGSITDLTPLGSQPGEPRRRSAVQPEGAVLSGVAVVSDELCGSGNYTVQMTLRPVADTSLELQDSFLALVAVQSSLQPVLQLRSCCVTPSSSLQGPSTVCCPLPRLPAECRHIQLLPSSEFGAASFTIQLFQMLNHSVAYLHCELNVCLQGHTDCEQDCFLGAELLPPPGDRNRHRNPHNLVSFGPVLRAADSLEYKPAEGPNSAMLVPILLGSLTGFAVLGSVFICLWLHHRQKTKTLSYPPFGEIHGP